MKGLRLFFCVCAVALFFQCTSMDKTILQNEAIRKPLPPLSLDASYDPYMMRVDLVRAYHNETKTVTTSSNGQTYTTTQVVSVPNSYHSLVADFGNGIVLDFNQNLCLDLVRLYNLSAAKGFRISYESDGLFSMKMECVKENNS